jgi:hypothetical protein
LLLCQYFVLYFSVTKTFCSAMQATVQDCEVQCVEGHPCRVKEWCSDEEGIYRCLSKISKIFESSIIVIFGAAFCIPSVLGFFYSYILYARALNAEFSNIVKVQKLWDTIL